MPKWPGKYKPDEEQPPEVKENPPLVVMPREEWCLVPRPTEEKKLKLPCLEVVVTDTGSETCDSKETCIQRLRELHKLHLELDLDDIAYNFLIGSDGSVYEGRGWAVKPFRIQRARQHTRDMAEEFVQVAFIGTYGNGLTGPRPVQAQCYALQDLVNLGFERGYIEEGRLAPVSDNKPPPEKVTYIDVSMFK